MQWKSMQLKFITFISWNQPYKMHQYSYLSGSDPLNTIECSRIGIDMECTKSLPSCFRKDQIFVSSVHIFIVIIPKILVKTCSLKCPLTFDWYLSYENFSICHKRRIGKSRLLQGLNFMKVRDQSRVFIISAS